jgi:GT2 family glycosyltransferase
VSQASPSFDLVVATVGRTNELARFLDSVEAQEYPHVRAIVVDQNDDDRIEAVVAGRRVPITRIRGPIGLSRARNTGLASVSANVVAFPDDDCVYPPGLLARVAARLDGEGAPAGLTGRAEDAEGRSAPSWKAEGAALTDDNLWNRAISFTIFLRRSVVQRVGAFDERLGLPVSSGEEIDYLIRALDTGARIEYDPSLVVDHARKEVDLAAIGARDGASIGYILRKHRYGRRAVAGMLVRPAGGVVLDPRRARFHLATLRGRIAGYRG